MFVFRKTSRQDLGPPSLLSNKYWSSFPGLNLFHCEADQSSPSIAEVKNIGMCSTFIRMCTHQILLLFFFLRQTLIEYFIIKDVTFIHKTKKLELKNSP